MTNAPRISSYYPPVSYQPSNFEAQSDMNFNGSNQLRALSPDDLQKMKYKIDLGSIDFMCFFFF